MTGQSRKRKILSNSDSDSPGTSDDRIIEPQFDFIYLTEPWNIQVIPLSDNDRMPVSEKLLNAYVEQVCELIQDLV